MKKILLITVLLILFSCKKQDRWVGSWELVEITYSEISDFKFSVPNGEHMPMMLSKDGTFLLTDDSIYTDKKKMVYFGKWSFIPEDSVLVLNPMNYINNKNQALPLKIKSNDGKNMKFLLNDKKYIFELKKTGYDDPSSSKHSFTSEEMNLWRIPSTNNENELEIKQRLINGLTFAVNYLEYHKIRNQNADKALLYPLPFRFASNGIAIKPNDEWKALFFNEENALQSIEILSRAFRKVADIPPNMNSPIEINIYILQETLKHLKG